ncbi:unnamed protein product [Calicophoron daubneyi]|uniref:Uncharacterized protein n=1 Tax=Calicophoron daubneyi TaxID=300641 RepID=A0AAV2T7A4_CALDB
MAGCFERTPYASVIASVLVLTGSGIMCGTNFEALRRTRNIFDDRFYPIDGSRLMQVTGIIYAVVTMICGIANVVAGVLTTGQTRQKICAHKPSVSNGKSTSRCLLITTYFVAFAWLVLFAAFAVPVSLWLMLHIVCREETEYWRSISADKDETQFTYIFNLTNYGLYRRPLDTSLYNEYISSPSAFTQLCQELSTVGPLFAIALTSAFLVLIGLSCFVSCLSSAVVRLEYTPELDRYRRFVSASAMGPLNPEEIALHPLMLSQSQMLSRSAFDARSNTFTYSDGMIAPRSSYQAPPSLLLSGVPSESGHVPPQYMSHNYLSHQED